MAKEWSKKFAGWPRYSFACRIAVEKLLRQGGSLSAYRSNPKFPVGPAKDSWAWRLERETERMFGLNHVIAVNSGTMALQAALYAMDLPKGGGVITTPFTFSATTAAILHAGLTPIFADVHPETFCLDPASVGEVLSHEARTRRSQRTVAILPVDLFGRLADYAALAEFGLPILEDACQAVGARRGGVWGGAFGDMAAFSFNGAKNVPAGEAGAVVTSDAKLAERARLFVSHGENFGSPDVGMNGRINEITACVAWHGLREVLRNNLTRKRLCWNLWRHLPAEVKVPPREGHALYVCPLLLPAGTDRPSFIAKMKRLGVEVGAGYIVPPLHQYPAFKAYQRIPMPAVEDLSANRLCILSQVRQPATMADMQYLAEAIRKALGGGQITGRRRSLGYVKPSVF